MDSIRDILPRTAELIAADFAAGQHKGFQLYVSLKGEVIVDDAAGEASPGVPMDSDTLVCWLSSGKPLTAMAIARLWQQGLFSLDARVSSFIPEFSAAGKRDITIRHLLTHTCGFPNVETGFPHSSWSESLRAVYDAPVEPDWVVGRTAGYHTTSSWFVLGELLQRIGQQRLFDRVIRTEITEPFGMVNTWVAMPEQQAEAYGEELGWMWRRAGKTLEPLDWHEPPRVTQASPGSSARGPIRELGHFYKILLGILVVNDDPFALEGDYFTPQTVEAMVSPHRVGEFDKTFQHIVDFGLGFLVNSNRYGPDTVPYSFGKHASPRAFGHGGSQSSIGFADPEHGLVVAWAANAMIGEPRHQVRNRAINTAIYEDLGLA